MKILVPLDGSVLAESIFPCLKANFSGAEIKVLHVIPSKVPEVYNIPSPITFPGKPPKSTSVDVESTIGGSVFRDEREISKAKSQITAYLDKAVDKLKGMGFSTSSEVIVGDAPQQIVEYANKVNADVIAMTTHGFSGHSQWYIGSVAIKVARANVKPVLLVPTTS
ncbi:MAG: universal stress protein [Dehalococcoidia bacterium]|nr:universal stress protein [Dehalococcoidia bacterium]